MQSGQNGAWHGAGTLQRTVRRVKRKTLGGAELRFNPGLCASCPSLSPLPASARHNAPSHSQTLLLPPRKSLPSRGAWLPGRTGPWPQPGSYIRSRQEDGACAIRTQRSCPALPLQELDQHPLMEIRRGRWSSIPGAPCRHPDSIYNFPESITCTLSSEGLLTSILLHLHGSRVPPPA